MSRLKNIKNDLESYFNEKVYKIISGSVIEIKEKDMQAGLKRVKILIDNDFKTDVIVKFNTNPKQFLKIMKSQRNCDYNLIVEDKEGKTICFLIELKTTIYNDDLLSDDDTKGQIKSTFTYIYMLLRFLDICPEFRAIVFYKNDRRSRLAPTDIDSYLHEIDFDNNCWYFKLPNNRIKVKFTLIQADND